MADTAKTSKPGWRAVLAALRHRKTGYMLLFGFAAGLPYALLLGTLYAWLSDAEVDLETMGVFSLIGLAYAFKFLWSPALDRVNLPIMRKLGKRKQWIVTAQLFLGASLVTLSQLDPVSALGWFSLLAGLGAFASATQDVVIDAWRVDVADDVATIDILSTVYQMGYRLAALAGGALALVMAERTSWPTVYLTMGAILLVVGILGLWAPDTDASVVEAIEGDGDDEHGLRQAGQVSPKVRGWALAGVGALWGWALIVVGVFMVRSLGSDPEARPDSVAFITTMGPLVVVATVVVPAFIAAWLVRMEKTGKHSLASAQPAVSKADRTLDHLYRALVLPLTEFVGRMGWSLVLVLALVLTYRITDSVWGTFAYPFYLGELQYSKDEVAFASKFFGVGAIVLGLALGGYLLTAMGRMQTLLLGAILAALTNLLYADLSVGGYGLAIVSRFTGFSWLVEMLGSDVRMAKLLLAIGLENLAIGIAGAAFVAWLSSIVTKGYSAVQYALLSSLTMLVGTLGRGALGQMIEERGYFDVFILTTAIGGIAVLLVIFEWVRSARQEKRAAQLAATPAVPD